MNYQDLEKVYEAQVRLGATTPSFDLETEIDETFPWEHITTSEITEVIHAFTGELEQMPPIYSAKSVDGKRAYNMARKGKTIELKPQQVEIHRLEILKENLPDLSILVECSKGTYIRSLARDIGEKLNSGAHLTGLRRTRIGPYKLEQAISIDNFITKLELL
jgi:tRNA pseudouridine55 synthase